VEITQHIQLRMNRDLLILCISFYPFSFLSLSRFFSRSATGRRKTLDLMYVDSEDVTIVAELGRGSQGVVYMGRMHGQTGTSLSPCSCDFSHLHLSSPHQLLSKN
jgi:hypothetical protein